MQSYWEIISDEYLNYIKQYVVGIGPGKDTLVPVVNNYMATPTDLVSRAHAHNLQVQFFKAYFLMIYGFDTFWKIERIILLFSCLICCDISPL